MLIILHSSVTKNFIHSFDEWSPAYQKNLIQLQKLDHDSSSGVSLQTTWHPGLEHTSPILSLINIFLTTTSPCMLTVSIWSTFVLNWNSPVSLPSTQTEKWSPARLTARMKEAPGEKGKLGARSSAPQELSQAFLTNTFSPMVVPATDEYKSAVNCAKELKWRRMGWFYGDCNGLGSFISF